MPQVLRHTDTTRLMEYLTMLPTFPAAQLLGSVHAPRYKTVEGKRQTDIWCKFDKLCKLIMRDVKDGTIKKESVRFIVRPYSLSSETVLHVRWGNNNHATFHEIAKNIPHDVYSAAGYNGEPSEPTPDSTIETNPTAPIAAPIAQVGEQIARAFGMENMPNVQIIKDDSAPFSAAGIRPIALTADEAARLANLKAQGAQTRRRLNNHNEYTQLAKKAAAAQPAPTAQPVIATPSPAPHGLDSDGNPVKQRDSKAVADSRVISTQVSLGIIKPEHESLVRFAVKCNGTGFTKREALAAQVIEPAQWSDALSTLYRARQLRRVKGCDEVRHTACI